MKPLNFLAIALLLCTAGATIAQDDDVDNRDKLQLGITGGFNVSNLYDASSRNFVAGSLIGGVFGGFLSIPIGTYLGLQPEVLYSQKGFGMSGSDATGQYYYIDRSNYIDVPILLQFKPIPEVYFLGGPEFSYLLSNIYTAGNGYTITNTEQQSFSNNNLRHNIMGLMLGADFNLGQFSLGGRIAWDLQDNNGNGTSYVPRYRNYWWQFVAGLRL